MRVEGTGGGIPMVSPHAIHKYFAGKDVSPRFHQLEQEIEFLGSQSNQVRTHKTLPAIGKYLDPPDMHNVGAVGSRTPENGFYTQDQFPGAEWLRHVVVSTKLESD